MSGEKELLQSLCNLEIPNAIRFSPDGRNVLYSTELTWGHQKGSCAVSTLWLAKTEQENSAQRLTSGLYKDYAGSWAPDGKSIAFISDHADAGKKWAIYVLPLRDGEYREAEAYAITDMHNEKAIDKFAFSPDGRQIAFLSADEKTPEQKQKEAQGEDMHVWGDQWSLTRLRIVDLETRKVSNLASDRHLVDFCWSPDGMRIAFASSRTPELENSLLEGVTISTVDADLALSRNLCSLPRSYNINLTWVNDGQLYVCSGVPADKLYGGYGIYSIDPSSSSPSYEHVAFGIDDDAVGLTKASNGEVLVKVEHHLESRISSLRGKILYGRQQEIEAFDVTYTGKTEETTLAIATSDVNHPVEVFTTVDGGATMVQLSNHGEAFRSREFGTCNILTSPSNDATVDIEALYLSPATRRECMDISHSKEALPTVVMVHGGPNTRLTDAFNTYYYMFAPYLLSAGYGILIPNYRGSSGRGKQFAEFSVEGVGKHDYADIITMTQCAIEQGYADKDKLLICGWSQGGSLTFLCSVRNGLHDYDWKFKAAVAGAGISDSDSMALTSDLGSVFQPELHNGRVMWNMDRNDTRNRQASPLWEFRDAIQRSQQSNTMVIPPMLILHGEEDTRCAVSNAWGMRRALESQKLPFELVTYPRQGHIFSEQKFWIDMALRLRRWCDTYIGVIAKFQHVRNAFMPARPVHIQAPAKARGLPSGYIASIEERLAQTEAALLQALSTIHGAQVAGSRSPPAATEKARDMEYNEVRIAKVEEWQKYPLDTQEHQWDWMQYKFATDPASIGSTRSKSPEEHASQPSDKRQLQGHQQLGAARKRQKTAHESQGNRHLLESYRQGFESEGSLLTRSQASEGEGEWTTNTLQGGPLDPDHGPADSTPWTQGTTIQFPKSHRASNTPSVAISDHPNGVEAPRRLDQTTSKAKRLSTLHSRKYF
ncbi:putative acylamino-acid-releasing enzyme, partial [Aureobasidium melanogenum]